MGEGGNTEETFECTRAHPCLRAFPTANPCQPNEGFLAAVTHPPSALVFIYLFFFIFFTRPQMLATPPPLPPIFFFLAFFFFTTAPWIWFPCFPQTFSAATSSLQCFLSPLSPLPPLPSPRSFCRPSAAPVGGGGIIGSRGFLIEQTLRPARWKAPLIDLCPVSLAVPAHGLSTERRNTPRRACVCVRVPAAAHVGALSRNALWKMTLLKVARGPDSVSDGKISSSSCRKAVQMESPGITRQTDKFT